MGEWVAVHDVHMHDFDVVFLFTHIASDCASGCQGGSALVGRSVGVLGFCGARTCMRLDPASISSRNTVFFSDLQTF